MVKIEEEIFGREDIEVRFRDAESEYAADCYTLDNVRGQEPYKSIGSDQSSSNSGPKTVSNQFQPPNFELSKHSSTIKNEIKLEPIEIEDYFIDNHENVENISPNDQNTTEVADNKSCVIDISIKQLIDMTVLKKFHPKRAHFSQTNPRSLKSRLNVETIDQIHPIIKLDKHFLKRHFRAKWIKQVKFTFRRCNIKNACQLCRTKILFKSPIELIQHYADIHSKEITWHNCTLCTYSKKRVRDMTRHWEDKHSQCMRSNGMFTMSKKANTDDNVWIGDDELVRSMFQKIGLREKK